MNFLVCDGDLSVHGGSPICSGAWLLVQAPERFDPSQLDPAIVGQAFGAGFGLVAMVLVGTAGVRAILNFLKSA